MIVHVMGWTSQQYGSFERFLVALTERCRAQGMESHLVFDAPPASAAFVRDCHASVHAIPAARGPTDARSFRALGRLLKAVGASHVHAHHGTEAYQALLAARLLGVPRRITTKHQVPSSSRRSLSRTRHRWLAGQVDTFFAVSEHVRRRLLALGLPPELIEVCYLGVDADAYRPDPSIRARTRRALGVDDGAFVVLSTSHLRPGKGVEALPELAASLAQASPDASVMVAGGGPLRHGLERRARELGLSPSSFRLLGVREDVPDLLRAADAFVFPTTGEEGLPLGPLEALAAGVPVVATGVSDLPLLLDGVGIVVPPADVSALIAACRRRAADPRFRTELGEGGRRLARGRLSVAAAVELHVARYLD